MRSILLFIFTGVIVANAAGQKTERIVPTPPGPERMVKAKTDNAIINDITASYDQMEAQIEIMFAKLIKEARDNKQALEDQLKSIDRKIDSLKDAAKKQEQQLTVQYGIRDGLISERSGLLQRWRFDLFQSILALTTAIADANRVINDIQDKIDSINKEIQRLIEEKKTLTAQIKQIDVEIAALEKDKQKALAELRKQKEKALREGNQLAVEENLNELTRLLQSTMNTIVTQLDSLNSVKRFRVIR